MWNKSSNRKIMEVSQVWLGLSKLISKQPLYITPYRGSFKPAGMLNNNVALISNNRSLCSQAQNVKRDISNRVRDFKYIPGPKSLPLIGTLWQYLPIIGEYKFNTLYENAVKKYAKYGSIIREEILPGVNVIFLYNPDDIEVLMRSSGQYPERRSHTAVLAYRRRKPEVYKSGGLLATNGEEWLKSRRSFQKLLTSPSNANLFNGITDSIVTEFVERIKQDDSFEFKGDDFIKDLARLNLQLICAVAFGVKLNSFTPEELSPESVSSKLIEFTLDSNLNTVQTDSIPEIITDLTTKSHRIVYEAQDYLEKKALEFISQIPTSKENQTNRNENEVKSLVEMHMSNPDFDLKDVIGVAIDLIMGGIDTTSSIISFTLFYLTKYPDMQKKLFDEAVVILPNPSDPVTPQVLNKASYLKAFVREVLRKNPISIGIGRVVTQDLVIAGYYIPKGTFAVTLNQISSNLPEYFENPEIFLPERWLRKSESYKMCHPFVSIPFGHGPRMCIARRLAEQNIYITVLKLVRCFDIGWIGEDLKFTSKSINQPDGPVRLTFKKKNEYLI